MGSPVISAKLTAKVGSFVAGMRAATVSMRSTGAAAFSVAKAMGALSVISAGIGAALGATFSRFQKSMAMTGAITGATTAQLAAMGETAKQLGATTIFTATQAADGMQILAKAGLSVNQVMAATPAVLDLAAASGMNMADSASIAVAAMAGYSLKATDLGRVNDVLVKTFTSSNTTLEDLGNTLKMVGPVGKAAGVSFEELNAAVGLLGNVGIRGTRAGTVLRRSLLRLVDPPPKAAAALRKLGVEVKDQSGNLKPLATIFDDLKKSGAGLQDLSKIFGVRAAAGMARLVAAGGDAMRAFTTELENARGEAERLRKVQLATLSGQFTILRSKVENLALDLGERLSPVLMRIIQLGQNFVDALRGMSPATKNLAVKVLMLTTGLSGLVAGLAALKAVAFIVGPALGALLSMLSIFAVVIVPIGVILLSLAVISAELKRAWDKNLGGMQDKFEALKKTAKEVFAGIVDGIKEAIRFWKKFLGLKFGKKDAGAPVVVGPDGKPIVEKGFLESSADTAKEGFKASKEALKKDFQDIGKFLKKIVPSGLIGGLKKAGREFKGMWDSVGQGAPKTGAAVSSMEKSLSNFRSALMGVGGTLVDTRNKFEIFIDGLKDSVKNLFRSKAARIFGSKLLGGVGGLSGKLIGAGTEGFKAGGKEGAAAAIVATLLTESKAFKDMLATVNDLLGQYANWLGELLKPMMPLVTMLLRVTLILQQFQPGMLLLTHLMEKSMPIFKALFEAFRFVGIAVLKVARFLLKSLGKSTRKVDEQLRDLRDTSYDTVNEVEDLGKSAGAAADALFNVPEGVKIAAARFRAAAEEVARAKGGPGGPAGGLPGADVGGVGGKGGQGETDVVVGAATAGNVINIANLAVSANDPEELSRKLNKAANRQGVLQTGGLPGTHPFTTGRGD